MIDYLALYRERWDIDAIAREAETGTPVITPAKDVTPEPTALILARIAIRRGAA